MDSHFFTSLETRLENRRNFYGRFQLGPFDSGQGLTIANAFRRTLLSECTGLGIIVVELEGASHEYATLPGVQESVLEILLNLKQIVLTKQIVAQNSAETPRQSSKLNDIKLTKNIQSGRLRRDIKNKQNSINIEDGPVGLVNGVNQKFKNRFVFPSKSSDKPSKTGFFPVGEDVQKQETIWSQIGYLRAEGPKIVRARDMKLPEPLQCVDPNQYLATLTYDGKLNIKLLICQGKNSIIHNLLPTHFNQSWFFHSTWFYHHKIALNPMTVLLLKDRNNNNLPTNPKGPATPCSKGGQKIKLSNKQLFNGWQQRKKTLKKFVFPPRDSSDKQKNVQPKKVRLDLSSTTSKLVAEGWNSIPIRRYKKETNSKEPVFPHAGMQQPVFPIAGMEQSGTKSPTFPLVGMQQPGKNPTGPANPKGPTSSWSWSPGAPAVSLPVASIPPGERPATSWKQRPVSIFELTSAVQNPYDQKQSTFDKNLLIRPNNFNNPPGSTTPKAGSEMSTQSFTQSKEKINPVAPAPLNSTNTFFALSENAQKPATDSSFGIQPAFLQRDSQKPVTKQPAFPQGRPKQPAVKQPGASDPGTTTTSALQGSDPVVSLPDQESSPLALGQLALTRSRPLIVDSVFLPVQKVNYTVEFDNTFDITKERVILEIWTNGSIHPRKALSLAAKRLLRLFYTFVNN